VAVDDSTPGDSGWDEASGMPDPMRRIHAAGLSPYGPEGEIFQIGGFASGVGRATGWRRAVGIGIAALILASILGSAVVSVLDLAGAGGQTHIVQGPDTPHLP
jgi:hypothetical protein